MPSLLLALSGCLPVTSELELTVDMTTEALDSVVFPIDLIVDFGREEFQRTTVQLCERAGDSMSVEVEGPFYEKCPSPARITAILVSHEGACASGELGVSPEFPEDDALALGEILIFDDQLCDVTEQRTLTVEPLPEE